MAYSNQYQVIKGLNVWASVTHRGQWPPLHFKSHCIEFNCSMPRDKLHMHTFNSVSEQSYWSVFRVLLRLGFLSTFKWSLSVSSNEPEQKRDARSKRFGKLTKHWKADFRRFVQIQTCSQSLSHASRVPRLLWCIQQKDAVRQPFRFSVWAVNLQMIKNKPRPGNIL